MSPDEAYDIVTRGRAHTREQFPERQHGVFVGHFPAYVFDRAVDVLAENYAKLLYENEVMRRKADRLDELERVINTGDGRALLHLSHSDPLAHALITIGRRTATSRR